MEGCAAQRRRSAMLEPLKTPPDAMQNHTVALVALSEWQQGDSLCSARQLGYSWFSHPIFLSLFRGSLRWLRTVSRS